MAFKPISRMMHSKNKSICKLGNYFAYLFQYRNLLKSTVKKEFNGKFNNTVLGYGWHLINPLFQIVVYYCIFTMFFGKGIPNYWVYLSTGLFGYVFASQCISGGANTIISNSHMVTKMAFPREILVISKVTVNFITMAISYCLVIAIMLIARVRVSIAIILLPFILVMLAAFCLGIALILSAACVYLRDIANAASLVMSIMVFSIPIMYLPNQMATPTMELIWSINPLYYYAESIHDVFYYGMIPELSNLIACILIAIISVTAGLYIFSKLEHGFVERL